MLNETSTEKMLYPRGESCLCLWGYRGQGRSGAGSVSLEGCPPWVVIQADDLQLHSADWCVYLLAGEH